MRRHSRLSAVTLALGSLLLIGAGAAIIRDNNTDLRDAFQIALRFQGEATRYEQQWVELRMFLPPQGPRIPYVDLTSTNQAVQRLQERERCAWADPRPEPLMLSDRPDALVVLLRCLTGDDEMGLDDWLRVFSSEDERSREATEAAAAAAADPREGWDVPAYENAIIISGESNSIAARWKQKLTDATPPAIAAREEFEIAEQQVELVNNLSKRVDAIRIGTRRASHLTKRANDDLEAARAALVAANDRAYQISWGAAPEVLRINLDKLATLDGSWRLALNPADGVLVPYTMVEGVGPPDPHIELEREDVGRAIRWMFDRGEKLAEAGESGVTWGHLIRAYGGVKLFAEQVYLCPTGPEELFRAVMAHGVGAGGCPPRLADAIYEGYIAATPRPTSGGNLLEISGHWLQLQRLEAEAP